GRQAPGRGRGRLSPVLLRAAPAGPAAPGTLGIARAAVPARAGRIESHLRGEGSVVAPRRCVFLGRDGVINRKPPEGDYVRTWREFQFLPGVADWIQLLNALGLLIVVVTNQRGVATGLIRSDDLQEIHRNMTQELARAGARIDDIFTCPHENGTCE